MATVASGVVRAEEHVALVPNHKPVTELGLDSTLQDVSGKYGNGFSHVSFTLADSFNDRDSLSLAPGNQVHLMLAWSHEPDFNHHSAWRSHVDIIL